MQDDHINILFIEDDPFYAEQSQKMLQFQKGEYRVDISTSAEDGLSRIGQERYHLLLLDMSLPGMNGLEALEKITKDRIEVPVIFLVKEEEKDCAQRALELGALDYLMKVEGFFTALPFTVERVLNWYRIKGTRTREIAMPQPREEETSPFKMIEDLTNLYSLLPASSLDQIIKRITELACRSFHFQKAVFYLFDAKRGFFGRAAALGPESQENGNAHEISREFVDGIFANAHVVKMLYCSQKEKQDEKEFLSLESNDRRKQNRRSTNVWLKGDKIFLNFTNGRGASLACLSLEDPIDKKIPSHEVFLSMKIFAKVVSTLLQNFLLFSEKDHVVKRLKQILATSNIFRLYLSLENIFKEAVWNIRFSLGFNLVLLGLLVEKTGKLEIKASACDDKEKQRRLQALNFSLKSVVPLLRNQFRLSHSYFIVQKETVFSKIKNIYRKYDYLPKEPDEWPSEALLLTPIKNREGKIIGFLITDDPVDGKKPTMEDIQLLEKLSNQLATAIENRMLYLRAKRRINELREETRNLREKIENLKTPRAEPQGTSLGKLIFRWSGRG